MLIIFDKQYQNTFKNDVPIQLDTRPQLQRLEAAPHWHMGKGITKHHHEAVDQRRNRICARERTSFWTSAKLICLFIEPPLYTTSSFQSHQQSTAENMSARSFEKQRKTTTCNLRLYFTCVNDKKHSCIKQIKEKVKAVVFWSVGYHLDTFFCTMTTDMETSTHFTRELQRKKGKRWLV